MKRGKMQKNGFTANVTNEQVAALPPMQFGGRIVVVDEPEQIAAACDDLQSCAAIGFDTETRPSFKAGVINKTALLQLSTPDRCYLFRLCRIPLDKRILHILSSKSIVKVGADVGGDLRALRELRYFNAAAFADLQDMASGWGVAEKSVRKLAAIVLGGRISKAQRLSNWEAASLTPAQQAYAATDAWVCLRIYDALNHTERKPLPAPKEKSTVKAAKKEERPPQTTDPDTEKESATKKRRPRWRFRTRAKRKE